jgi:molybdate transport system substrate-binding protein
VKGVRLLCAAALAAAAVLPARAAATLAVAAAANLSFAMAGLDAEYQKASPGASLTTATGASGSLVAEISNGAPFDVFLSADMDFARRLASSGHAVAASLTPFASGRLVLWSTRPGLDVADTAGVVRSAAVRRIAIANPESAPFGRAARQALAALGLLGEAQPKLVTAENIAQAAQFVDTGNADAGFVALSAVLSPQLKGRGRWAEVPARLYEPLLQVAVITARGASNPEAARYVAFLRGPAAARVLESLGYAIPGR